MRSYNKNLDFFYRFIQTLPPQYSSGPPNAGHVLLYIARLYQAGLCANTITSNMSSLSYYFNLMGVEDLVQHFLVKKALVGVRKLAPTQDLRLPITVPILQKFMANAHEAAGGFYKGRLLKAMVSLCFYCFLRPGEVTASVHNLPLSAIQVASDHIVVTFKHYKHSNGIPATIKVTAQKDPTCPVRAIKEYLQVRGDDPGPLFCSLTMHPISYKQFQDWFKALLIASSVTGIYNLHSFRVGAATLAAARGYSVTMIQGMGRWKSAAYKGYIRVPQFSL